VFHRTEGDHDLISTIHYLQEMWCQDTEVYYEWVKGHAYDLNKHPIKLECLNIVAGELCDITRETARGPFGARPTYWLWPSERCALFIQGVKVTSNWKERLRHQLLDIDLQEYLMKKKHWTAYAFDSICWKRNETALKQISKARQAKIVKIAKMCHNL
jgi:hypothetical protein